MADDDDSYQLDENGDRVLIGLTAQETAEFVRLDAACDHAMAPPTVTSSDWTTAEDLRWLELYEKHEAARRPFLAASKTRH